MGFLLGRPSLGDAAILCSIHTYMHLDIYLLHTCHILSMFFCHSKTSTRAFPNNVSLSDEFLLGYK